MDIKTVYVVGAGFMGRGIAQVSADKGYKVYLWDIDENLVTDAINTISSSLDKRISRGKETQENKEKILGNITVSTDLEDAKNAELVIEAIVENMDIKKQTFAKLDEICHTDTILATNTSALSVSEISNATKRADKFIGLHFFSPVPVMKLVEIVNGLKTSSETSNIAKAYIDSLGKAGVFVKDGPGFLVNRVMHAFRQEVLACLDEGVATIEDIDLAIKLGLGHPMGPFELNDFAGLDIGYATIQTLYENFKDPKWRPNLTLKKLVAAGEIGKKAGKGWYDYTSGEKKSREDISI